MSESPVVADFIKEKMKGNEVFIIKRMLSSKFVVEKWIYMIENPGLIVFKGGNRNDGHTLDKSITETVLGFQQKWNPTEEEKANFTKSRQE